MNLVALYDAMRIILNIYLWIILAYCILSMIFGFGFVDPRNNRFLMAVFNTLARLVEPVLRPIRAVLPSTGMMDFSPLILLLIIQYGVPYVLKLGFRMLYALQGF